MFSFVNQSDKSGHRIFPSPPKVFSCPLEIPPSLYSYPQVTAVTLRYFIDFYVNGIIYHVLFCVWILPVHTMVLRSIHVPVCSRSSFLFILSSISVYVYTAVCVFIPLLMDIWVIFSLEYY